MLLMQCVIFRHPELVSGSLTVNVTHHNVDGLEILKQVQDDEEC